MLPCTLLLRGRASCCVACVCVLIRWTMVNALHVARRASDVLRWTRFMLRCARVFNSVNVLHVLLRACALSRWTHFMSRCARMLHFGNQFHITLRASVFLRWPNFTLRCSLLSFFRDYKTWCYVARFCWSPLNTLHVTLRAFAVLQWTRFMLRLRACVFYFGERASRFAARVCCTSVTKLHVALHTSAVLRWTHFMLRCALLLVHVVTSVNTFHVTLHMLYFGERASCYAARVCFNSGNALHAMPRACVLIRWMHFMLRCAPVL